MTDEPALYVADAMPLLQNTTYADADEARRCATGRVELRPDPVSGIVTNVAFEPERMVYDSRYQNEQAHSSVFLAHLEAMADVVCGSMDCSSTVEIGCGKGRFLDVLARRGVDCTGIDPAYEGGDPRIRAEHFLPGARLRATAVVLRHVLEHVPDPMGFLQSVRDANGGTGSIYVEVPCFDWIRANRTWFDVFYEHVNYFRARDFLRMFTSVRRIDRCFGGQYLGVVAELADLRDTIVREDDAPTLPGDFTDSLRRTIDMDSDGRPCAVWGASSKGVIFSIARARRGSPVAHAVDVNPAKQGRHLPVTGLEVLGPDEAVSRIPPGTRTWVMNSNYLSEIGEMAGHRLDLRPIDLMGERRPKEPKQ